jgi:hypothetical protein
MSIFWNVRKTDGTPFLRAYEQLLRDYGTDYAEVRHVMNDDDLRLFFGTAHQTRTFSYEQVFDFDGIRGRLLSSSYVPREGDATYAPMLAELRSIFDAHADGGQVRVLYDTDLYYGTLASTISAGSTSPS